jgi:small subunit ribosomal protein S1
MRVTCQVTAVKDNGIEAKLLDHDLMTFIRRSDLSRDRSEQRPDRFGVGEKFDAVVTQVDAKTRKVSTSIKALEIAEEKEAVAQYGSTDSGASLGDILGAALNKAKGEDAEEVEAAATEEEAAEKPKPKRKAKAKAADEAADEAVESEASSEE